MKFAAFMDAVSFEFERYLKSGGACTDFRTVVAQISPPGGPDEIAAEIDKTYLFYTLPVRKGIESIKRGVEVQFIKDKGEIGYVYHDDIDEGLVAEYVVVWAEEHENPNPGLVAARIAMFVGMNKKPS